ncbi:MAG: hypothetical protein V6Z81_09050 [Parvularculales bacterium]
MTYLMRLSVGVLLAGIVGALSLLAPGTALAQDAGLPGGFDPGCLMNEERPVEETIAWWNRRSPEEQELMMSLPCEERYIPAVCIFLGGGEQPIEWVRECSDKQVAERRSFATCQEKGFEMMTEEFVACQDEVKATY